MLFMKESNAFSYEYLIKHLPPPPIYFFLLVSAKLKCVPRQKEPNLLLCHLKNTALVCDLPCLRGLMLPSVAL